MTYGTDNNRQTFHPATPLGGARSGPPQLCQRLIDCDSEHISNAVG